MLGASRLLVVSVCAAVMLTVAVTPAQAVTVAGGALPYCNRDLDTGVETCASSESGLRVALAESAGPTSYAAATSYVLARLYDDINRTGVYYSLTGSAPCDTSADLDLELANIGSTWNDRVSSFQGYYDCQIRVYADASFGGSSYGAYTYTDYVGAAMNDLTTSVRLY